MNEQADDEQLAARARAGDTAAFETLVDRFREQLRTRVQGRLPAALRQRVSGSDIVQESLMAAHRRLPDFEDRGPGSFGRWLGGIADHKVREGVRNHLVRARRDAGRDVRLPSGSHVGAFVDDAPSPGSIVVSREDREAARAALSDLPDSYQEILRLVHEAGLTVPAASEYVGRTPEATRKLYARAVASLAKAVGARRGEAT